MNVSRVKRAQASSYIIHTDESSGGRFSDSFQQQLGQRKKEDYRRRAAALFDEITRESATILEHVDLPKFENYRRLIREFLNEVAENAYGMHLECACDAYGKKKIYTMIDVIDQKLDEMAREMLRENRDWFRYVGRVDEIRGLIMDLLL